MDGLKLAQTDRWMDRWKDSRTDKYTDRQTCRRTDTQTDKIQTADSESIFEIGWQTDRGTTR